MRVGGRGGGGKECLEERNVQTLAQKSVGVRTGYYVMTTRRPLFAKLPVTPLLPTVMFNHAASLAVFHLDVPATCQTSAAERLRRQPATSTKRRAAIIMSIQTND